MKKTTSLMTSALFLILAGSNAFASEVTYEPVTPVRGDYKSLRDAWDKSGQFCYETEAKKVDCMTITQRGEIVLREKGTWSAKGEDQVYINNLPANVAEVAGGYFKLYVRYMAFNDSKQFVAHIFFLKEGQAGKSEKGSMTILAFGAINNGEAAVTSMSHSNSLEAFGALLSAAVTGPQSLRETSDIKLLYSEIVKQNSPLLQVGQSVVNTYLKAQQPEIKSVRP